MEKKLAGLIPPSAKSVLEFVGEGINTANGSKLRDHFLLINPE